MILTKSFKDFKWYQFSIATVKHNVTYRHHRNNYEMRIDGNIIQRSVDSSHNKMLKPIIIFKKIKKKNLNQFQQLVILNHFGAIIRLKNLNSPFPKYLSFIMIPFIPFSPIVSRITLRIGILSQLFWRDQ